MTQAAVLTGDLIDSTSAGPEAVDQTLFLLERFIRSAQTIFSLEDTHFTRFRGDGWQTVIMPSSRILRVLTYLLSGLRSANAPLETRIGIGLGQVTRISDKGLSASMGAAFILSGHALDEITSTSQLAMRTTPGMEHAWLDAAIDVLTYLSSRWSLEQAEALHARLGAEVLPLHEIASTLGISRQALSSRLAVAGEKPLMALIRAAEATL
jgi:hypothetical protein